MPSLCLRSFLGIGLFVALTTENRLMQAQSQQPTPAPVQAPEPQPPLPSWIPVGDVVVEVIAPLPLRTELVNVTRLLGERQSASGGNNDYASTILELIRLVEPNPQKPRGRSWKSINALEISFDKNTKEMIVAYCVDKCALDQKDHSKRKMISYRAPEELVTTRVNERLAELQSVERPTKPR